MSLTPIERREQCNPFLIGALAAFVSPASSIIWGIRQRSWSLALVPFSLVFFFLVSSYGETSETQLKRGIKYSYQISIGIIAYEISKTLKMKAHKSND